MSALVIVWHCALLNSVVCIVNFTMATAPEVVAEADDDLLALLGFKIWNAYGRIESPVAGYIRQGQRSLGEMRPHY